MSPTGDDSADGSPNHPFRTVSRSLRAVGPGERITVRAGTYSERVWIDASARSGQPDAKITLQGEGRPRLTYQGSEFSVVQVEQPNWIIDGFVIDAQKQRKAAVAFAGQTDGSSLVRSEALGGTSGAGITTYGGAHGVTIEANEIHDFSEGDQDSHGVLVQPTSQNITVRNNRIHDVSGDSVQCIGPEGYSNDPPADGVLIEGNELFHNRENAVDIKTCHNVTVRQNNMHDFRQALPGGCIVVVHMSAANVHIEDNEIYDGGKGIALGGNHVGPPPSGVVIERNRIHDIVMGTELEGVGVRVENSTNAQILNNTFSNIAGPALMVGFGTGGATQGLVVTNNIVAAPNAVSLGSEAPGLALSHNLYLDGAKFADPSGQNLDLAGWQSVGRDVGSTSGAPASVLGPQGTPGPNAVDHGQNVGLPYCGAAPDIGAEETGCKT